MEIEGQQIVITGNELNTALQEYFGSKHIKMNINKIVRGNNEITFLAGDGIKVYLDFI